LIASETTTALTFQEGDLWYRGCRGVQVLSALYAFNCPTFLFTQKQWKIFVENSDRNAVYTFPCGTESNTPYVKSTLVQPMGTHFLQAIIICLLPKGEDAMVESMKSATIGGKSTQLSKSPIIERHNFEANEYPQRKSTPPKPSFISDYIDGQTIYTKIRVLSKEDLSSIQQEMAEYIKKA
jgi:hypothetical protein